MTDGYMLELSPPEYDQDWFERYDRLAPADAEITQAEMTAFGQLICSLMPAPNRREVKYLDLGTCTGRYLRWGCRQGFGTVCGVDSSPASIAHCARVGLPADVHLYQADFLDESVLRGLAAQHGPFHLVTAMLGTVNHVPRHRHAGLLDLLGDIMTPGGVLILSSWRAGRCHLSLYSEQERGYLEQIGFGGFFAARGGELAGGLRLTRTLHTPWHVLAAFTLGVDAELP